MNSAIQFIAEERERQVKLKGWTPEHDDTHCQRELAQAALSYLEHYVGRAHVFTNELGLPGIVDGPKSYRDEVAPDSWPWAENCWNPKHPMRDLIRAGALIAAEIDRLNRAAK